MSFYSPMDYNKTNSYPAKVSAINNDATKVWRVSVEKLRYSSNNHKENMTHFDLNHLISERNDMTAIWDE